MTTVRIDTAVDVDGDLFLLYRVFVNPYQHTDEEPEPEQWLTEEELGMTDQTELRKYRVIFTSGVAALAIFCLMVFGLQWATVQRDIEKSKTDQIQAQACETVEDESARTLCIAQVDD